MRVVEIPDALSRDGDLAVHFELRIEEGGQDIGRGVARADVLPSILINLAPEKPAAIGPLLTKYFGTVDIARIVDHERAPLTADDVLGFMEALGGEAAERA